LNFTPTRAAAAAAEALAGYPAGKPVGEAHELAVRAVKGGREIFSGYQYAIKVRRDVNTVAEPKVGVALIGGAWPVGYPSVYVPIGTTKDLLSYFNRTAPAPTVTLTKTDFFKVGLVQMPGNSDVEHLITKTDGTVSTGISASSITNLNDKLVPFTMKTFDWMGMYREQRIDVTFYSALNTEIAAIPFAAHTLTASASPADQKEIVLTSMFTTLDGVGKTELWRTNATNVEVKLVTGTPAVNIVGVAYEFLDANGVVIAPDAIGTWGPVLTTLAKVQSVRKIRFTYDETTALAGSYTGKLQFTDRRAYVDPADVFTVSLPFTIANPDMTTEMANAVLHKDNTFDAATNSVLIVYGTFADLGGTGQTVAANAYYDLYRAYKNLDVVVPAVSPKVAANKWRFAKKVTVPAGPAADPLTSSLVTLNKDRFNIVQATMYSTVPYQINLYYYYFGNPNNAVLLETITVYSKSEVKEGALVAIPQLPATAVQTLQVVNGDLATTKSVGAFFKVNDILGVNLNAFSNDPLLPRNVRAASVTLTNTSSNAHLVSVTPDGNNFLVKATAAVAELPQAYVDVTLKLTVTDLFNQKLERDVVVRVVKP